MIRLIKLFLFATAFTFIFSAQALQLGKISINSKQEQPLNADIEVILTKADDVTELVPSIASKVMVMLLYDLQPSIKTF